MNPKRMLAVLLLALLTIWMDVHILRQPQTVTRITAVRVVARSVSQPPQAVRHTNPPRRASRPLKTAVRAKPQVVPQGAVAQRIARAWPGNDSQVLRVAACESGLNPRDVGSAGERGVLQIHPVHIPAIRSMGLSWSDMFFVEANVRVAWALYKAEGWSPWMTCGYRQFGPR